MFTPQEIQEQTFSKAVFGGYDMQQVDDFLEPLTEDYITLYKENSVLKAKMKILVEKLEEYRAQETKQSTATADAEARSAQMLKETQARCAAMLQNAEVNAQANAQVNAANVQLAQLNQQIHAEQERLDYAKQTALNRVPGASASNIYKFKLDFDDGRWEYEGEIRYGTMEYDFTIDAASGNIIEWDMGSIYD